MCHPDRDSASVSAGEINTRSFTIQEYRIYREVISSPSAVPEGEAIEDAAQKHGVPPAVAREAAKHVQEVLFTRSWFASPDAEIRHASDWNGETQ